MKTEKARDVLGVPELLQDLFWDTGCDPDDWRRLLRHSDVVWPVRRARAATLVEDISPTAPVLVDIYAEEVGPPPPVLVVDGTLYDGIHRTHAALARGRAYIPAVYITTAQATQFGTRLLETQAI